MPSLRRLRLLSAVTLFTAAPGFAIDKPLVCAIEKTGVAPASRGDARTREAAQRGINFLAQSTAAWGQANKCYGCHVQAVTLEGLAVGKHNQYEVPAKDFAAILDSILHMAGGARSRDGLSHPSFKATPRTFGGVAFARYDQYVDSAVRDDLYKVARQLLEYQAADGLVHGDHQSYPVTAGVMQATYQAMQTWRQAYARSADSTWLAPMQKAEKYIQATAAQWQDPKAIYLQDVNYALMGLMAAGVGAAEETPARLARHLLSLQNHDGGWGFNAGTSEAFATGQTVYTLRAAGLSDREAAVTRGTAWLVEHQQKDGSWGASGSGKAEAMWGVLGLVSVDVMSVSVAGLTDGQHVGGVQKLDLEAKDNQAGGLSKVELWVDDRLVEAACGGKLSVAWDTGKLSEGKHLVDAVATNLKGQVSRRRLKVYAGNVFLTQLGSRFEAGATQVTFRNIGSAGQGAQVQLKVFPVDDKGQPKAGKEVFAAEEKAVPGAMGFTWAGKAKGRFVAQVSFKDAEGKVLQRESTVFFQDTEEEQRAKFGEVQGALSMGSGSAAAPAANALVELVDDVGNVVQATRSTEAGQYRFKNVDKGNFKVRVRKEGFAPQEAKVEAAPAREAAASMSLH